MIKTSRILRCLPPLLAGLLLASCQTSQPVPSATASAPAAPAAGPAAPAEPAKPAAVAAHPETDMVTLPAAPAAVGGVLEAPAKTPAAAVPSAVRPPFYDSLPGGKDDSPMPVTLAFDAAGVTDVVPAFAQILGFNFILDPQIKGTVTMTVNASMSRRQVWEMFDRSLRLVGAVCTLEQGVLHIAPLARAPQVLLSGDATGAPEPGSVQVELIPIQNTSSKELLEKLKPFLSDGATALDISGRNAILLVENAANLAKVKSLLLLLDQRNKANWPQEVIQCRNVPVTRIRNELLSILPVLGFPVVGDSTATPGEPGAIQLLSLDRMQALVATAANAEAIAEVRKWVAVLDRTDVGEQESLFVYKVVNGKAEELLQLLEAVFTVEASTVNAAASPAEISGAASGGSRSSFGSDSGSSMSSRSSSGSSTGSGTAMRTSRSGMAASTTANAAGSASRPAGNRAGGGAAAADENGAKTVSDPASVFEIPVKIAADAAQNRLLVRATPRVYAMIQALLNRLDTAPSQVLLEVVISEITLTDSTQFGVEFSALGAWNGNKTLLGMNYKDLVPGGATQYGLNYYVTNPANPSEKFAYLRALAGKGRVDVLSSPQVVVVSNTTATIEVGNRVPIVTSEITDTASTTTDNTSLQRAIQYENTGTILKITPSVTKGGLISLHVDQEVSDAVATDTSKIDSPTIQNRRIETSLAIRDGSTLFVGGLIRTRKSDSLSGPPILIHIPYLNRLFGYTDRESTKTELVMMITGRIITEDSRLDGMLQRYKQSVDALRQAEGK